MMTDQAKYTAICTTVLIEHAPSTQVYRDEKCTFSVNCNVLNGAKKKKKEPNPHLCEAVWENFQKKTKK